MGRTWLSLLSQLTGSLDLRFCSVLLEVLVSHDFTTDKLVLEVRAAYLSVLVLRFDEVLGTDWMTPAAAGALRPDRMVHARTSSGPPARHVSYRLFS